MYVFPFVQMILFQLDIMLVLLKYLCSVDFATFSRDHIYLRMVLICHSSTNYPILKMPLTSQGSLVT